MAVLFKGSIDAFMKCACGEPFGVSGVLSSPAMICRAKLTIICQVCGKAGEADLAVIQEMPELAEGI